MQAAAAGGGASWDSLISALNPFLWVKHDETSGTTLTNSGSWGLDGVYAGSPTLGASPLISGSDGKAVTYSGSQRGYIDTQTIGILACGDMTMEVVGSISALQQMAICHTGNTVSSNRVGYLWLILNTGEMRLTGYAGGYKDVYSVGANININEVMHLAVTLDTTAQLVSFYKDGALINSVAWTWGASDNVSNDDFQIGAYNASNNPGTTYQGTMDDLVFHKGVVLSAEEIASHAAAVVAP